MFKDTIITARRKKQELIIYAVCLAGAFILNVVGIIMYNTPLKELYTQLHIVFLISWIFYFLTGVVRLIVWGVRKMIK